MATGLKNAGAIIPDVLDVVQFSVNEQCAQYKECGTFRAFIDAGKPVFHIEYPTESGMSPDELCQGGDFSTVLKDMNLDGKVTYCDGTTATTPTIN
jgi:hypothetical protein